MNLSTRVAFLLSSISKSRLFGNVRRGGTPAIAPHGRMDPTFPRIEAVGPYVPLLSAGRGGSRSAAARLDIGDGVS